MNTQAIYDSLKIEYLKFNCLDFVKFAKKEHPELLEELIGLYVDETRSLTSSKHPPNLEQIKIMRILEFDHV